MSYRVFTTFVTLVLCLWSRAAASEYRTWTDTSDKFQVEAALVASESDVVKLKKRDGHIIDVQLERLSHADQKYVRQAARNREMNHSQEDSPSTSESPTNTISLEFPENPGSATTSATSSARLSGGDALDVSPLVRELVVTGIAINAKKALQNAFSRAIEQAVGVLIDSETRIENDEIIRDEVLAHSRGFMEEYDVLKRWEADGVHHAQIRARVAAKRLTDCLTEHNVAMRSVEGEQMSLQLKHEIASEQDAAAMFARIMEDHTIENLFDVEILEKPEILEKDAVSAKLMVPLRLTPNWENWAKLRERLGALLCQIAVKRSTFSTVPKKNTKMKDVRSIDLEPEIANVLPQQLAESDEATNFGATGRTRLQDPVITLLKSRSRSGNVTAWDIFRVPDSSRGITEVLNQIKAQKHQVRVVLLNATQDPLMEKQMPLHETLDNNLTNPFGRRRRYVRILQCIAATGGYGTSVVEAYWIGPLFWDPGDSDHRFVYEPCEVTLRVELDLLGEVSSCAAFAEVFEE